MITFLLRAVVFLASAAVGLIVADIVLPGFSIDWRSPVGFILAIVIFAVLQSVLAPWLARVAQRNAPAFLGGIGIVSTFVALVITALIPGAGLTIGLPWWTWIVAPMIVWVVTAIAAFLLPAVLLKKKVQDRRES
ncbi:phage holin family protein [Sphingomonas sp. BLCC-B65]|nr:phage holin family protein [Sphingomonas sp. BLCC-B65]